MSTRLLQIKIQGKTAGLDDVHAQQCKQTEVNIWVPKIREYVNSIASPKVVYTNYQTLKKGGPIPSE